MDSVAPPALTLSIRNASVLDNGSPLSLVLDSGKGATIGRAGSTDWPLPDPERHISSRHCEIRLHDGAYEIVDSSTNGTFVNGSGERLAGPYRLCDGDVIHIGDYEIAAALAHAPATSAAPAQGKDGGPAAPAAAENARREERWTMFALPSEVDWARGGFGGLQPQPEPAPAHDPARPAPVAEPAQPAVDASPARPPAEAGPARTEHPPADDQQGALDDFLAGAGIRRDQLKQEPAATLTQAGMLLRRLIAGLVVMLEARARAKSQLGAQGTGLEIEGNNPLKFARTPEQALQFMLNPRERGFMSPERAVEDGLRDIQAHQLATLKAMQGALRSTLDRFSPKAIRSRADTRGLFERLLPGSRDAALWKAYEQEFSGVAFDSDEAFMDMFAKEFREAYDAIARQGQQPAPPGG